MTEAVQTLDPWLLDVVRRQMPRAEEASVELVTAVTTLLANVAFADGRYTTGERERVRQELSLVLGMSETNVAAVCEALGGDIARLAGLPIEPATAVLHRRLDAHMRADAVKVLVEIAGADHEFAPDEIDGIRAVAERLSVPTPLLDALLSRAHQLASGSGSRH